MRNTILFSLVLALAGCESGRGSDIADTMLRCWGAKAGGDARSAFEFQFEGVYHGPAIEGGYTLRSRNCPDHRFLITEMTPASNEAFAKVRDYAEAHQAGSTPFKGAGEAVVTRQKDEMLFELSLRRVTSMEALPPAEASAFRKRFHLD